MSQNDGVAPLRDAALPPSGLSRCASQAKPAAANADRFYIDCEFDGHGGPLLSFGIESEAGRGLHYRVSDAPPVQDPWVAENIVPIMGHHCATLNYRGPLNALGAVLRKFIEPCERPIIIADSPVDIGRFCAAISTNMEGGWASADFSLMRFEVHNVDCWPNDLVGGVQHNAWWDARALRHKLACVSNSDQNGEDAERSGAAEGEASQSGGEAGDAPTGAHP